MSEVLTWYDVYIVPGKANTELRSATRLRRLWNLQPISPEFRKAEALPQARNVHSVVRCDPLPLGELGIKDTATLGYNHPFV